jgi:hypothetical protein
MEMRPVAFEARLKCLHVDHLTFFGTEAEREFGNSRAQMVNHVPGPRVTAAAILNDFLGLCGERAGARTQDPVIKSHVLYRLSYALDPDAVGDRHRLPDSGWDTITSEDRWPPR